MTTVIGVDGIGGDVVGGLLPRIRAFNGIIRANRPDAQYVIAVPPGTSDIGLPSNVQMLQKDSLENAISFFLDEGMAIVTGFNTQQGVRLQSILNRKMNGVEHIVLAAEIPRRAGGTAVFLDVGANSGLYVAPDIRVPSALRKKPTTLADYEEFYERVQQFVDRVEKMSPSRWYKKGAHAIVEFARLGALYMELRNPGKFLHSKPRVGLFNIGAEEGKGNRFTEYCHNALHRDAQQQGYTYVGYAEPKALSTLDVWVGDGDTNNKALKVMEETVEFINARMNKKWIAPLIKIFSSGKSIDQFRCAPFLGLTSVIVKVHGEASEKAYAAACNRAYEFSQPLFMNDAALTKYSNLPTAIAQLYTARYIYPVKEVPAAQPYARPQTI